MWLWLMRRLECAEQTVPDRGADAEVHDLSDGEGGSRSRRRKEATHARSLPRWCCQWSTPVDLQRQSIVHFSLKTTNRYSHIDQEPEDRRNAQNPEAGGEGSISLLDPNSCVGHNKSK